MNGASGHEAHDAACGCGHHHPPRSASPGPRWGAALLPLLACAFCPSCLATYAKVLSVLGVSVGFDPAMHQRLLAAALATSLVISAWRAWKQRRVWPLLVALSGTALVAGGHALGEWHVLEWAGTSLLLAGAWAEHFRMRRRVLAAA